MRIRENLDSFVEIKKSFEKYFKNWNIKFPDDLNEFGMIDEIMSKGGWSIEYSVDYDSNKVPELSISAHHRMTNSRNFKIRNNGEISSLERMIEISYPKNDEKRTVQESQNLSYIYHRKLSAVDYLSGNSFPHINHSIKEIYNQGLKGNYKYSNKLDKLHPDFQREFIYKGRKYNSISHCLNFYELYYYSSKQDSSPGIDLLLHESKKLGIDNLDSGPNKDSNSWENRKQRIVFEALISLYKQNEDLLTNLLKNVSEELILETDNSYWGIGKTGDGRNTFGLIQATVCFWLYYAYTENAKLI